MAAKRKKVAGKAIKLEELKSQLAEAVQTLDAIRSGGVDALVIHGPQGEQVFTLKGADQVYRILVDAMNEGAVSISREGTILYCNTRLSEMLKTPVEKILGAHVSHFSAAGEKTRIRDFIRKSFKRRGTMETVLLSSDERELAVYLSSNPVPLQDGTILSLVITDISDRKRLEQVQQAAAKKIYEAQEQERQRVSRELHDGINQLLSSAKHRLHSIEQRVARKGGNGLVREIVETRNLLEKTIQEVRLISRNLRPSELDDLGLAAAVQSLLDEFSERTGIRAGWTTNLPAGTLDPHKELAIYRIVQEALTNIEKHAKASGVNVAVHQDGTFVAARIRDNGRGFSFRADRLKGLGLANMQERAAFAGGTVAVKSAPGRGTEVRLQLPL